MDIDSVKLYTGLTQDDSVLDLGCGFGRLSRPLLGYLRGRYIGIDVNRPALNKLKEDLGHDRFIFFNAKNQLYNPNGTIDPGNCVLPIQDRSFSVVLALDLFTHFTEDWTLAYLSEIARILKPGGRVLASFFLISPHAINMMRNGRSSIDFRYGFDHVLWPGPHKTLEEEAAYYDWFIFTTLSRLGLTPTGCVYGNWCGVPSSSYHDLIVAVKL